MGRDYETVKKKLREALEQAHRNIPYIEKEWTVGEYLDYWMCEVQRGRISDNTWSSYSRAIKNHLKPTLGGHSLKELSVGDVRQALKTLERRKSGVVSVRKSLQALSSCLSCAMREELVFLNVAQLVEKPQYTPRETEIWTKEQATHFLRAIQDHPQYVAFLLLFTYGMRRAEALGLRYSDIDFENKRIHIRQQVARVDGIVAARPLKTKNSRRTLPLVDIVECALLEHARRQGMAMPPRLTHIMSFPPRGR
jgi:integrase